MGLHTDVGGTYNIEFSGFPGYQDTEMVDIKGKN
jgi:hypothetical protein